MTAPITTSSIVYYRLYNASTLALKAKSGRETDVGEGKNKEKKKLRINAMSRTLMIRHCEKHAYM